MTVSTKKYLTALAATAVLATGLYGCGGGGESALRADLKAAEMAAAAAEAAKTIAEQAQMVAEAARAEADRLRMEAEEAARMASEDAAAAEQRAVAAEQRATDAEANAADAREALRLAQEALASAEAARMMAEQRASGAEGALDALAAAVVARNQANVIDLVANDSRQHPPGNYIGSSWRRQEQAIGVPLSAVTHTYAGGRWVNPIVSHDGNELQHNVAIVSTGTLSNDHVWAQAGRNIATFEEPEQLEGVTNSATPVSDHGLGSDWQATLLTADYDHGGTLTVYVATDLQASDGSVDPFQFVNEVPRNIELPTAPSLPGDEDYIVVAISYGDSIDGLMGSVEGSFSCANTGGCWFVDDHRPGDYLAIVPGITFTPDGGTAQDVVPRLTDTVPAADYLAFGHWLYVPDDVTDLDDYNFGVYGSGGDPYDAASLAGLTGTATYEGAAVGMYYLNGLSGRPDVGSFTAEVALTADFGDGSATGFIDGQVSNFEYEGDVASSLPSAVDLTSNAYSYLPDGYGVPQGSTNIFDTGWGNNPEAWPGGAIAGWTEAGVGDVGWGGSWNAAFYGNDPNDPNAHPTGVAGTFSSYVWNHGRQSESGLAGSFGAHLQDGQ